MQKKEEGVVYLASHGKYIDMAVTSAKSIKQLCPDLGLALFTEVMNFKEGYMFDYILPLKTSEITIQGDKRNLYRKYLTAKYNSLIDSPFSKTLFLDPDTYCIGSINEVFKLLTKFDIILTYAHDRVKRFREINNIASVKHIPMDFNMIQGGVIYCNTDITKHIWKRVVSIYQSFPHFCDQTVLRKVLWEEDVPFYILPSEYNFNNLKYVKNARKNGYLSALPRIIHYTTIRSKNNHIKIRKRLKPHKEEINRRIKAILAKERWHDNDLIWFNFLSNLRNYYHRFKHKIVINN